MDGQPDARPESATAIYIPGKNGGTIHAPFNSETAKAARAKRNGRSWSWEEKAYRHAKRRIPGDPEGKRRFEVMLDVLATMAMDGDVRAIELYFRVSGWRPETRRTVEHGLSGDILSRLSIGGDGDKRGIVKAQVVDAAPVTSSPSVNATQWLLSDAGTQVPMPQGDTSSASDAQGAGGADNARSGEGPAP